MGMYDHIRVAMPLPVDIGSDHRDHHWQTKSLACDLDHYEIREDGTLWHQEYDTVDNSDPNAKGLERLAGMVDRVNCRWVQVENITGEIRFYDYAGMVGSEKAKGWLEFSVYLIRGKVSQFELIEWTPVEVVR